MLFHNYNLNTTVLYKNPLVNQCARAWQLTAKKRNRHNDESVGGGAAAVVAVVVVVQWCSEARRQTDSQLANQPASQANCQL